MNDSNTAQSVLFTGVAARPVAVGFDQECSSSDGGALLLKLADQRLGLSATLASCLVDRRRQSRVTHSYQALFAQRMYGIACGYADGNDAARLANDPVFKMLSDRDPVSGRALASQPTLSRFENAVRPGRLLQMSEALAQSVIDRHRRRKRRIKRITIDLDPTDDRTHGNQQLSFFNWHYDSGCYLPLAGFMTFDDEPQQYLFCYMLRSGRASAKQGCLSMLKRLVPRLRKAFGNVEIRIRLDAGFSGSELYEFFESERLKYVVCMSKNAVLLRLAEPLMAPLKASVEHGEAAAEGFGECRYKARHWSRERRVLIKADIALHPDREPKANPRFIVTNLTQSPKHIYRRIYCARGDAENRIKELKRCLAIDRTSCTSFVANQLRVLMTAAAYVLMQEIRLTAKHTACARSQVSILRLRLLKVSAWIKVSVRRIVVHLPKTMPYAAEWRHIAQSLATAPP